MTLRNRLRLLFLTAIAVGGLYWVVTRPPAGAPRGSSAPESIEAPRAGGALVASIRGEPRSFNRLANRDTYTDLVALLTQAKLVRVNRATDLLEPWLIERWEAAADGLTFTLFLRPGLAWSDGTPFVADDVRFALEAVYDPRTASPLREVLLVDGQPLAFTTPGPLVVELRFPAPYGPGLRILDNLPILPRHRLESFHRAGTLGTAWGVATPPSEIAGLGPLSSPSTARASASPSRATRTTGARTSAASGSRISIGSRSRSCPTRTRSSCGFRRRRSTDADGAPARGLSAASPRLGAGALILHDLGIGLDADGLWFSLGPQRANDPRREWLTSEEFRHAISLAVDRAAFVDAVFLGAAVPLHGPVTPGNRRWFCRRTARRRRTIRHARRSCWPASA